MAASASASSGTGTGWQDEFNRLVVDPNRIHARLNRRTPYARRCTVIPVRSDQNTVYWYVKPGGSATDSSAKRPSTSALTTSTTSTTLTTSSTHRLDHHHHHYRASLASDPSAFFTVLDARLPTPTSKHDYIPNLLPSGEMQERTAYRNRRKSSVPPPPPHDPHPYTNNRSTASSRPASAAFASTLSQPSQQPPPPPLFVSTRRSRHAMTMDESIHAALSRVAATRRHDQRASQSHHQLPSRRSSLHDTIATSISPDEDITTTNSNSIIDAAGASYLPNGAFVPSVSLHQPSMVLNVPAHVRASVERKEQAVHDERERTRIDREWHRQSAFQQHMFRARQRWLDEARARVDACRSSANADAADAQSHLHQLQDRLERASAATVGVARS